MELFRLVGNVILDASEALQNLDRIENRVNKVGEGLKKAGQGISSFGKQMTMFSTVPIVAGLAGAIKASSDLNETLSKTEVVFKKGTDEVLKWGDSTLKNIGLAKISALDMAAVYGDMGTSMGLNADFAREMSMSLVDLTGDMASFKNMRPDEIHIALAGAYTGETEALKRLGIVMTQVNLEEFARTQGIKKKIKEMTQAEKVALRYEYIMSVAKNSIGDFKRTQESAANQTRIFTESLKEIATNVGDILLPYFTRAITFVNSLVDRFRTLPPHMRKVSIVVSLVVAALGPLLVGFGMLISFTGSVVAGFSAIIGAIAAVGFPLVAATAAFIAFTGVVIASGAVMLAAAKKAGVLKRMVGWLKTAFVILKEALTGDFMTAVNMVAKKFGVSKDEAYRFVKAITDLKTKFLIAFGMMKIKGKEAFKTLIDHTIRIAKYLYKHRADIMRTLQTFLKFARGVINHVIKIARTAWRIIKWGRDVGNTFWGVAKKVKKFMKDISKIFSGLVSSATKWGINLMKNFISGIGSKLKDLKNMVTNIPSTVKSLIGFRSPTKEGPGRDSDKWSPNLMNMFIQGIQGKLPALRAAMRDMADELKIQSQGQGKLLYNAGIAGNAGGVNVNVTMNYPNVSSDQNINETMEQVQEKLEDWINFRRG
jgi:hypothetical protein